MWKKEMLLFFVTTLDFVFLVHGDFGQHFMRSGERYLELEKYMNLDGIVKLAKTQNGEDVICVDVYKQPAFKNPLLKNHKLQWQPTTFPSNFKDGLLFGESKNTNFASENTVCPPNSIPIRKTHEKIFNGSTDNDENNTLQYRFALLELMHYPDDMFYGASTLIKYDHPHCENGQNSGVSIWIASDNSDQKNVIKAGWMVYPEIYGDEESHLSIYWTSDGFHQTGCYDYLCPGFVQLVNGITLGERLPRYSVHGSEFWYMHLVVFQDISTQHWWLLAKNFNTSQFTYIGYWPKELFTRFDRGGTVLNFGGSTMAHSNQQFPPMGDGYFPDGNLFDSNYFRLIQYVNKSNYIAPPRSSGGKIHTDNPNCYGLIYQEIEGDKYGHNLYLGGPGGKC